LRPGNGQLEKKPHSLKSPADRDHVDFLDQLQQQKGTWETQKSKGNKDAPAELLQIEQEKDTAEKTSRDFGSLYASSGFRRVNRFEYDSAPIRSFMLDWGLLKISGNRTVSNNMPRASMALDGANTKIVPGQLCNTWTPLNKGKVNLKRYEVDVVKHGRTTGYTFGSINCGLTKINPEADPEWIKMAKTYNFSEGDVGHCYSVIKRGKREFVEAGDSGSIIVHDASGTWLGLLFGESGSGAGLMIPIHMIFEDVKQVTGLAVVDPKQDDDP
jgi:hypothetical protein